MIVFLLAIFSESIYNNQEDITRILLRAAGTAIGTGDAVATPSRFCWIKLIRFGKFD